MCSTKRRGASLNSIIPYTLPKLHTGKNWYIDFKAYDPLEQKMKRKKYMLDSIDKISVRKKRATELIANISRQLQIPANIHCSMILWNYTINI